MQHLFAVIRARGPAWQSSEPMANQADWASHAAFMNRLEVERFVLLGGPLEGTSDVLLVVKADSAEEVHARLEGDPWTAKGLLRIKHVTPWSLRLGSLE